MALHYAMERKTFGKAIAEHQAIQLKLAEMSTRAATGLLVHQAADKFDHERCDFEASGRNFCLRGSGEKPGWHARIGGYSYSPEYEIERFIAMRLVTSRGE